jgi:peptidylprolyl isomerase
MFRMTTKLNRKIYLSLAILIAAVGCILAAGCTGTGPAEQSVPTLPTVPGADIQMPEVTDPSAAQAGDNVTVDYTGKLNTGEIFDSSVGRGPLMFTLGDGSMIPGFEQAIYGMKPNENKTFTIAAADAYGPRVEELVQEIPKEKIQLPEGVEIKEGDQLFNGLYQVTVLKVGTENVTIDNNHPLAGKDLTFDITLTGLEKGN